MATYVIEGPSMSYIVRLAEKRLEEPTNGRYVTIWVATCNRPRVTACGASEREAYNNFLEAVVVVAQ